MKQILHLKNSQVKMSHNFSIKIQKSVKLSILVLCSLLKVSKMIRISKNRIKQLRSNRLILKSRFPLGIYKTIKQIEIK